MEVSRPIFQVRFNPGQACDFVKWYRLQFCSNDASISVGRPCWVFVNIKSFQDISYDVVKSTEGYVEVDFRG